MSEIKYAESCCDTCREMTVSEEISALDIDEKTKNRILKKVSDIENDYRKQEEYLMNCHNEIHRLERALIEVCSSLGCDIYNLKVDR